VEVLPLLHPDAHDLNDLVTLPHRDDRIGAAKRVNDCGDIIASARVSRRWCRSGLPAPSTERRGDGASLRASVAHSRSQGAGLVLRARWRCSPRRSALRASMVGQRPKRCSVPRSSGCRAPGGPAPCSGSRGPAGLRGGPIGAAAGASPEAARRLADGSRGRLGALAAARDQGVSGAGVPPRRPGGIRRAVQPL
jgi:hypothetical protein